MAKYLNLFTDYGFKKFFCDEANQELLLDFLNALLVKYHRIKSVAITTEQPIVNINHKNSPLYNVDCISSKGEAFLVLLQKNQQKYFLKRDIYYSIFPFKYHPLNGPWNKDFKTEYYVDILDFRFSAEYSKGYEEVLHTHEFKNDDGSYVYEKLAFFYLEMPNFIKTEHELETHLDKWLYFIKNLESFEAIPDVFKNDALFKKAFEKAEIANLNNEELEAYNASLKEYTDDKAINKSMTTDTHH